MSKGGNQQAAHHGGDVLLEGLAVLVVELLRVVVRRLLRAHVVYRPARRKEQNPRSGSDRSGSRQGNPRGGRGGDGGRGGVEDGGHGWRETYV